MIDGFPRVLTVVAVLGAGLVAGIFFAFSSFVMKALERIRPAQGIAAMQSINIAVINPLFMTVFMGTGLICVLLGLYSFLGWHRPGARFLLAGSLIYLLGSILVTMAFNVPRNNALAAVDPAGEEGARLWAGYVAGWTAWNHVRTVASLASSALFTLALRS